MLRVWSGAFLSMACTGLLLARFLYDLHSMAPSTANTTNAANTSTAGLASSTRNFSAQGSSPPVLTWEEVTAGAALVSRETSAVKEGSTEGSTGPTWSLTRLAGAARVLRKTSALKQD